MHQRPAPLSFQPAKVVAESIQAVSIRYNNRVYEMQRKGIDVTVLSLGEAFFDIPLFSFGELPKSKIYHYTHSRGIPELREELARYFRSAYQVSLNPDTEILVTAGSKIGIYFALQALLDPGDEVIVLEPAWVSYPEQVRLAHGVSIQVPYSANVLHIEKYIRGRTKAIILNNPNNPSGRVYTRTELTHLLEVAEKHKLKIISDEAYSDFLPDPAAFISMAHLDPEKQHTIVVNSISKNFGISGWRLGYVISSPEVMSQILKLNQHLITCPASILQYYLAAYFTKIINITRPQINEVVRTRNEIKAYIDQVGLSALPGDATFYLFVSISPSKLDSESFCSRLLENDNVCVVPGIGYGTSCDQFVRLSVGTEPVGRIKAAIDKMKRLVQETA